MAERPSYTIDGSVVKIGLKNFMTYKNEIIYPGPNFNVTVGPNGSGKSSIVTALSICLGGDLSSLNRQLDLQSLINNDCGNQAASVEIELFAKKAENTLVKAIIKRGSTEPSWQINGKNVSKEKLIKLTERLQIQPNNLCQFLPQDVVREFPQMKPPMIFENTVKAVGDRQMLSTLYKGSEIQEGMEKLQSDIKMKENTISSLEQKKQKNEELSKKIEQLELTNERKDILQKALAWEKFSGLRKQAKVTRETNRALNEKLSKLSKEKDSHRDFLEGYNTKVTTLNKEISSIEKKLGEARQNIEENLEVSNLEEQIEVLDTREKDLDRDEKDRIKQKLNIQKRIEELQEYLQQNPLSKEEEQKLAQFKEKKLTRELQLQQQKTTISDCDNTLKGNEREINRLLKEKNTLSNKKNNKLLILQQENPDAYNGVLWLREHKNEFKGAVHEPIMLCLNMKDKDYAKYVELHIGKQDLEGFVCEDPDDMNKLLTELRERLKLKRINVLHSEVKSKKEDFKVKPEDLKKYGFVCYLSQMYDAPDAIASYLCHQKKLNQVPFFEKEIENVTDELKKSFNAYYIGNQRFIINRSKYSMEYSTGVEDIGSKRVIRLAENIDQSKLEEVETELAEMKKAKENNQKRKMVNEQTKEKINSALKEINAEISAIQNRRKEYKKKENEMTIKQELLTTLAEPKANIEEQKREIRDKKMKIVEQLCNKISGNLEHIKSGGELDLKLSVYQQQLKNVELENQDSNMKIKELEKEYDQVNKEYTRVKNQYDSESQQVKDAHTAASNATDGVQDDKTKYKPPLEWKEKFDKIGATGMDETSLSLEIDDCEKEIKRLHVKPEKLQSIKDTIESLERVKKEFRDLDKKKKNKIEQLDQLRRGWIRGVEDLVTKVNDKFGEMMEKLGYAGEVQLQKGLNEDPLDIKNYGIKILVKFRSGEEFSELSKGTQSGGEKSVTTAVYMMALQELTQVPFRCVDEINQGMDENNERNVWSMLLDVCKDHSAQYFYMAPKFPYNLPFDDQVTILVCNSGAAEKKKDDSFCTKKFVEISRNI